MKRILATVLTMLLLLCFCGIFAGAEETFQFTRGNFPKIDGSTSLVPLGQAIASVLLGESREDASSLISFNRTTQSFRNLQRGFCDLVIAAEPKSEVFDEMKEAGFPYLMETIAKEALVFVVNADNPVNSLTQEQVRGIYSGSITNWSQVGGLDLPIEAFQRNPTAGSQVMMEKLVMDGTAMMEAPATHIPSEMGELIEAVRSYDNSANAIGYTVFYYASDMQMADGLKILQIDGVEPNAETIRSEQYPYLNGYYCCIPAQSPPDSPARCLFDWLVTEAGQALLTQEGYVSVYAPGDAPHSGNNVVINDRYYAPSVSIQPVYTLFDCPHDHLEPRNDYGTIYPYDGAQLYGSWAGDYSDWFTGTMRGFYNHDGKLITDPVYSSIELYFVGDEPTEKYYWVLATDVGEYGFAAIDGSFLSDLCYESVYSVDDYILGIRSYEQFTFDIFDSSFHPVYTQDDFSVSGLPAQCVNGKWCFRYWDDDYNYYYYLLDGDGKLLLTANNGIELTDDGCAIVYDENWDASLLDEDLHPILLGDYEKVDGITPANQRFYKVWLDDYATSFLCDRNGTLFEWDYDDSEYYQDGCITVTRGSTTRLYSPKGRLLNDGISSEWNYLGDQALFFKQDGNELKITDVMNGGTLTIPYGEFVRGLGSGLYAVTTYHDGQWGYWMVNANLTLGGHGEGDVSLCRDWFTGDRYLQVMDGKNQALLTLDGNMELLRADGTIRIENGCLVLSADNAYTAYNPQGGVMFSYPLFGLSTGD